MNTGKKLYRKLRLVYANRYNSDGTRKPVLDVNGNFIVKDNTLSDPDYAEGVIDGCECRAEGVPCNEDTSTTTTSPISTTTQNSQCLNLITGTTLDCSSSSLNILTINIGNSSVTTISILEIIQNNAILLTKTNLVVIGGKVYVDLPKNIIGSVILRYTLSNCTGLYNTILDCNETSSTSTSSTSTSTTSTSSTSTFTTTTTSPVSTSTTTQAPNDPTGTITEGLFSCTDEEVEPSGLVEEGSFECDPITTTTSGSTTSSTTSTTSSTSTSSTTTELCGKGSATNVYITGKSGIELDPFDSISEAQTGKCANTGFTQQVALSNGVAVNSIVYANRTSGNCDVVDAGYYYIGDPSNPTQYIVRVDNTGKIIEVHTYNCSSSTTTIACNKSGMLNVAFMHGGSMGVVPFASHNAAAAASCSVGIEYFGIVGTLSNGLNINSIAYNDRNTGSCTKVPTGYYYMVDAGGAKMNYTVQIDSNGLVLSIQAVNCSTTSTTTAITTTTCQVGGTTRAYIFVSAEVGGSTFASHSDVDEGVCEGGEDGYVGDYGFIDQTEISVGSIVFTRGWNTSPNCIKKSAGYFGLRTVDSSGNPSGWVYKSVRIQANGLVTEVQDLSCATPAIPEP